MDPKQEHHAQQAPEVVSHSSYPEVVSNAHHHQYQQYPKPEGGPYSTYSASQLDQLSPRPYHSAAAIPSGGGTRKGGLCGCGVLVTVLSAIIALLLAAVVGLAAGTGVEANRASKAEARLASATATTTWVAGPTNTAWAPIDRNCSVNADGISGTTYDVFSCMSTRPPSIYLLRRRGPPN